MLCFLSLGFNGKASAGESPARKIYPDWMLEMTYSVPKNANQVTSGNHFPCFGPSSALTHPTG